MESTSFLYYNPGTTTQQSSSSSSSARQQHRQFVSQPPSSGLQLSPQQKPAPLNDRSPGCSLSPMPYPSSIVYSRPPSSSESSPSHIHTRTPILALTAEALQKSSGLPTPSSPSLLGLDGPNGADMYFSEVAAAMNSHLATPINQPWVLDEGCNGTLTPAELDLPPSTPQYWKERSPISPGMQRRW